MSSSTFPAPTSARIPWYIWCAVVAVTSVVIGAHWDISWHSSIGRDTFWTPAHMAIYLCGVLSGIAFGYLILSTTLVRSSELRNASVHVLGFRAPLGAFIASWGGIAMITSAPFDNWWHAAYGLDVKIISPPHALLFLGAFAVLIGTLVLLAGYINRQSGALQARARYLFLYVAGVMLALLMIFIEEYTTRTWLHSSVPYAVMAVAVPAVFALCSWTTRLRFAATIAAGVYTAIVLGFLWILPLFPAEPKLGPVYRHITFFVPVAQFPILIVVPAVCIDLLAARLRTVNAWAASLFAALVFEAALLVIEWPFASFLQTPAARNAFWGADYFNYGLSPQSYGAHHWFYSFESPGMFWWHISWAVAIACLSFRIGISRGRWMAAVQR